MADSNSSDDDGAWLEDANYSCGDLKSLALQILAIPGEPNLFANRMISCDDGHYSRSFYEAVMQIDALKVEGRSFEEAVRELDGRIPALEDLRVDVDWGGHSSVTRATLTDFVNTILAVGMQGPDATLADCLLKKEATNDDWKLMALRYEDIMHRVVVDGKLHADFFVDKARNERDFDVLRKHVGLVKIRGAAFNLKVPLLPPWSDIVIWHKFEKGYGLYYDLFDAPQPRPTQLPANQTYEEAFPLYDRKSVQDKPLQPKNAWVERASKKTFMNSGIGGKLQHMPPSSSTSAFQIDMSKAMSIKEVWGFALLGQYVGWHPGHFLINGMMKSWGVRCKYRIEEGWMIFYFDSEADQEKVLLGGPYLIQGRPLILKYIPDKFAFNRRDVATVPLWVRIHGLASRFWTPDILAGIASYIGTPLYMDPVTDGRKRHTYARVLVEINLAAPVIRKVPLLFSDGVSFDCTFLVENEPKYCHGCCSFGHDVSSCEFAAKKGHVEVQHTKALAKDPTPKEDTAAKFEGVSDQDDKDMAATVHAQVEGLEKTVEQQQDQTRQNEDMATKDPQSKTISVAVDNGEKLVGKQATMEAQPPHVPSPMPMEKVATGQPNKQPPPEPHAVSVTNRFAPLAPGTSSRTNRARKNGANVP